MSLVSQDQAVKVMTARVRVASSLSGLRDQARKRRDWLVRSRPGTSMSLWWMLSQAPATLGQKVK